MSFHSFAHWASAGFFQPGLYQVPGFVLFPQALAPGYRIAQHQQIEMRIVNDGRRVLPICRNGRDDEARREDGEEKNFR